MNKPSTAALLLGLLVGTVPLGAETAPEVAWTRQLSNSSWDDSKGVAVDSAGNAYITGSTSGSLGGPNAGEKDAFLARYNTDGSLAWTRQLGTSSWDESNGVAVDSAGNAYITGSTYGSLEGNSAGSEDAFLARYNVDGSLAWTRQLGTSSRDESNGVAVDIAGNAYITGTTGGSLGRPNPYYSDAFLAKFDPAGNELWLRQIGTPGSDYSYGVAVDDLGNAYITGDTQGNLVGVNDSRPNARKRDAFLTKFDASGTKLWSQQIGTTDHDLSNGVAVDASGNAYISGYTRGNLGGPNKGSADAYLTKFDTAGSELWSYQIGTPDDDFSSGVAVDDLGNAYISGSTDGSLGGYHTGSIDAFLMKIDAAGNDLWSRQIGTVVYDRSNDVAVDSSGNVYISGDTRGSLGGARGGSMDAFLVKFENARPLTTQPVQRDPSPVLTPDIKDFQPQPTPEGVAYSTQLRTYQQATNQLTHDPDRFDRAKPTIVLTHGWKSDPGTFDALLSALDTYGAEANIMAWDWQGEDGAGTGSRLGMATSRTPAQGKALAEALNVALGQDYEQPLHFLGHSLGTLVNARAITDLHQDFGFDPNDEIPVQATLFDAAAVAGDLTEIYNSLSRNTIASPFSEDADWTDNYVSLVGPFSDEAVNVFLGEGLRTDIFEQHRYPIEWYADSIDALSTGDTPSILGFSQAVTRPGVPGDFSINTDEGTYWTKTGWVFDSALTLEQTSLAIVENKREGQWLDSTFVTSGSLLQDASGAVGKSVGEVSVELFSKIDQSIEDAAGKVRDALRIRLFENSPAYYWLEVEVPEDALAVEFDFMFSDMSEEDFLTFGIDEELLFALEGEVVDQDKLLSSGLMNVEEWQGQNVEFFFGYNSDDITGGQIMIEDPRFYQVPEPTSLALLALGGLVLSHRRRR